MHNVKMLEEFIEASGKKNSYLADKLGLTYQGYIYKVRGRSEFLYSEVEILAKELGMNVREKKKVFLNKNGNNIPQKK